MSPHCARIRLRLAVLPALVMLLASGCASVDGSLEQGRARAAAGDARGAKDAFQDALLRARTEIDREPYVHLQEPYWVAFADTCVAVGSALDREEGFASASGVFRQCLGYAAGSARSPYFAVKVAAHIEMAWAGLARDRRMFGVAITHHVLAEAMYSTMRRANSTVVLEHASLAQASARALFSSMRAKYSSWKADREAADASRSLELGPSDVSRRAVDARWAMILARRRAPTGREQSSYGTLLSRVEELDRAFGARMALASYPAIDHFAPVESLVACARKVEATNDASAMDAAEAASDFEKALTDFFAWLGASSS